MGLKTDLMHYFIRDDNISQKMFLENMTYNMLWFNIWVAEAMGLE